MFCPNCGTRNDDTATPCTKCGFDLSGASAPKFRGTMMLNTDQSVQEMVDEHRRKLPEGVADPAQAQGPTAGPPAAEEATAPASVAGEANRALPPRTGLPKRRMGTMLGVAPQVGGVTPTPPPPSPLRQPAENSPPSAPDPLGGTIAFGAVPSAGGTQPLAASRTESWSAMPAAGGVPPGHRPLAVGRTEAFEAPPPPAAEPTVNALAAGRTEAFAAVPAPAAASPSAGVLQGRSEALEAPRAEPEPSPPAAPPPERGKRDSLAPAAGLPPRLRPLDVFLIIITCGLYALVLWVRQRKPS